MAHYFITGHTGFKGAWLTFLLNSQGHEVSGLGLDPLPGSIFDRTTLERDLIHDFRIDVRDREETIKALQKAKPDYVIHMAAQALVREGYRNPLYTYETNVLGTLNVLEAVDRTDSVRAQLIVTTDKVYREEAIGRPFIETDPLGGKDPYSASKAMADLLAQERLSQIDSKSGSVVRGGNVIGVGDVSRDRLVPDLLHGWVKGVPVKIRNPNHVRPWQHVLDCLNGYLTALGSAERQRRHSVFNVGPDADSILSVAGVVSIAEESLSEIEIKYSSENDQWHENPNLLIDSSRLMNILGWKPSLSPAESIRWTIDGFQDITRGLSLRETLVKQVSDYNRR